MANPVLIIVAVVFLILMAVANLYILVHFQHEEDKNTAIFPKIIVVFSLTLTCANVLMLPLDVANRGGGGLPMETIWVVAYVLTGILTIIVIPFAIFYYEAEDPTKDNVDQVKTAIMWTFGTFIIFTIITAILFMTLGVAEVPVTKLTAELQDAQNSQICLNCTEDPDEIVRYRVSIVLYLISMLTFVGVFLFILFGGIGLAALPMDLIIGFKRRPKFMPLDVYMENKKKVGLRAASLIEKGDRLKERLNLSGGRPKSRSDRKAYNKFRADVFLLEEEFKALEKCYNKGIGPKILSIVWAWAQLFLGLLGIVVSLLWIIHIFVYRVLRPPPSPFLNTLFIALDSAFGLFGTIAYGLFAFYLLWTVIKGNFKFGLQVPFLFEIHPMKVGETMMNSFLFNCVLLLLSSMAIVQFCTAAFSIYSRDTGIDTIFNVGVKNLAGIKYIWAYYYWAWIILAILSGIFLGVFAKKQKRKDLSKRSSLP